MAKSAQQEAFDREFRGHIERLTPSLVSALRGLIATAPPPEVKVLVFEVQSDWRGFPVHAFAMDDAAPTEVSFAPPFSGSLLPDANDLIPPGTIDQDRFEEAGVDTFVSGVRVLAESFGECWHAAGGRAFFETRLCPSSRPLPLLPLAGTPVGGRRGYLAVAAIAQPV